MTKHIDTIVVGGGQAGLSTSWHLKRVGREHLVFDRGRIGDTWRHRWDTFCLVTPNWCCRLPGFPYDGGESEGFMLRDEIVAYVERFAKRAMSLSLLKFVGQASLVDDAMLPS